MSCYHFVKQISKTDISPSTVLFELQVGENQKPCTWLYPNEQGEDLPTEVLKKNNAKYYLVKDTRTILIASNLEPLPCPNHNYQQINTCWN